MSNQVSTGEPEFVNDGAQVSTLLYRLNSKLNNFTVVDRQGRPAGKVQDLFLDADHQLLLVISQSRTEDTCRYLLSSKLIQDVDPVTRSLYLDISQAELERLPEYGLTEVSTVKPSPPASGSSKRDTMLTPDKPQNDPTQLKPRSQETPVSEVRTEEIVRLLEERLVVDRSKRKLGEVIVRKVIETEMIEVPVRREKLIVEQVSPELKQLAEIDLSQGEISAVELAEVVSGQAEVISVNPPVALTPEHNFSVTGEFASPKVASSLLDAIALQRNHGCAKIRIQIVLEDPQYRETYQGWFDRCSRS